MIKRADWIKNELPLEHKCPVFRKKFSVKNNVKKCVISITAMGVYNAVINGEKISNIILAPGWTVFEKHLQYQCYDITELLKKDNILDVTVGTGWYRGRLPGPVKKNRYKYKEPAELLCEIRIKYNDGKSESIYSDSSWMYSEGPVRLADIYDGEIFDASFNNYNFRKVATDNKATKSNLILQRNCFVVEQERIKPMKCFVTPKGETVIDFGQEITGYVCFTVTASAGDRIKISHGEVLDSKGDFYNDNYRSAAAEITYICKDGLQTYKPSLTFFGFRYIRIDEFPCNINLEMFTAVVVHSDIVRTGFITCGNGKVNQLFNNIIWGQKGNFVDIPTDCPQRDERLGWTGDAQVFVRTASYNFDVESFFVKWLSDLSADQSDEGEIPSFSPNVLYHKEGYKEWCSAAAWGDAACICPWQIYLTYGNKSILRNQFECMKGWIDFLIPRMDNEDTLRELGRYGDWLALDAEDGAYKGATDCNLITAAFFSYSSGLLVKAGKVLEYDVSYYDQVYNKSKEAFKKKFPDFKTQTECALAIYFNLCEDILSVGNKLNKMIIDNDYRLKTGFVGTPYLLHALSMTGHTNTAYSLLLQEKFPSWLFSVNQGATTIWEHWDSRNEKGEFWSTDMNSFNHYAYGSVADWMYGVAAGINTVEEYPGFQRVLIAPLPDERLGYIKASIKTRRGKVSSCWKYTDEAVRYEIITPSPATVKIKDKVYNVEKGSYIFYSEK